MERVRLAVRTRRRQMKLHILRHTHSAPMYSFVCRYLQSVHTKQANHHTFNTRGDLVFSRGGGGGGTVVLLTFFLVEQIDFPSSPKAIKRPCFGQTPYHRYHNHHQLSSPPPPPPANFYNLPFCSCPVVTKIGIQDILGYDKHI